MITTATPGYGGAASNDTRQAVNTWIRTQHLADGVIDFDAAVRDPDTPDQIAPPFDGGDGLHFSPAGYKAMADAIPLTALAGPSCTPRRTHRRPPEERARLAADAAPEQSPSSAYACASAHGP